MTDLIERIERAKGPDKKYRVQKGQCLSFEETSLVYRRTRPFLDAGAHMSLQHLMGEAYVQGMRDAIAALRARKAGEA